MDHAGMVLQHPEECNHMKKQSRIDVSGCSPSVLRLKNSSRAMMPDEIMTAM